MTSNVFGLDRVAYIALFAAAMLASAATFGTVVLGFQMHQSHVAQTSWVTVVERA